MLYNQIPWKKLNKNISFSYVQGLVNCSGIPNLLPTPASLEKRGKGKVLYPPAPLDLSESRRSAISIKTLCALCSKLSGNAIFRKPASTNQASQNNPKLNTVFPDEKCGFVAHSSCLQISKQCHW